MDVVFFMGMVAGFLLGLFFCLILKSMIRRTIIDLLAAPAPVKKQKYRDDDGAGYWKPDDWNPEKLSELDND